jgi:hypothetical protein
MSEDNGLVPSGLDPKRAEAFIRMVAELELPDDKGGSITERLHRMENQPYGKLQSAAVQLWALIREARKLVPHRRRGVPY